MSQLSTTPVMKCSHCGRPVKITHLSTTKSDADGTLLWEIFHGVAKDVLCNYCQQQYNYLAKEGRIDEWIRNRYINLPNQL